MQQAREDGESARSSDDHLGAAGSFATTRWTLVRAARGVVDRDARAALASLCEAYWMPLYAYVRRSGLDGEAARDATQDFFARVLEKRDLFDVEPAGGRFRAWILAALAHFLANRRQAERALKRGGGRAPISLGESAEARYLADPCPDLSPVRVFERRWALELLQKCLARLEGEYAAAGKGNLFAALAHTLGPVGGGRPRADLARELDMDEGALNVAAHRLRRRYREVLRAEVAHTVSDPGEVEDELRGLLRALAP